MPQQNSPFSDVADVYDQLSDFFAEVLGGSIHLGYWDEDAAPGVDAMAAASERLTGIMIDRIAVGPGQRVLDVGCGTGQPAVRLAEDRGVEVVGITVSAEQVAAATGLGRERGLGGRLSFLLADAAALPFPADSFDAAWLFESPPHLPDRARVLREVARVVRPGGLVALTDFVQLAPMTEHERGAAAEVMASFHLGGFCPLAEYPDLVRRAGLDPVEVADISANTIRADDAFVAAFLPALRAKAAEFGDLGTAAVDTIAAVTEQLNDLSAIGYALVVARA